MTTTVIILVIKIKPTAKIEVHMKKCLLMTYSFLSTVQNSKVKHLLAQWSSIDWMPFVKPPVSLIYLL